MTSGGGVPVSRPVGLLSTLSTIAFFVTILIAGGIYGWQSIETKKVADLGDSVAKVEKAFEPQLITQLQSLDRQLRNANLLLKNHTVISPVFDLLESSTLKQVKFTKLDIAFDDTKGTLIKMSGEADGYNTIAQQSDVLGANTFLKDTIFSNFFQNQKGRIAFDLSFGVRPDFVDFEKAPIAGSAAAVTSGVDALSAAAAAQAAGAQGATGPASSAQQPAAGQNGGNSTAPKF